MKTLASLALSVGIAITTLPLPALSSAPIRPVRLEDLKSVNAELGLDEQLWRRFDGQRGDGQALLSAIDHSIRYLRSPRAVRDYQRYRVQGITRDRVLRSLQRFRQLLVTSRSPEELQAAVQREFVLYQATGRDGQGNVLFTGYYEPTYTASRVRTAEYRYPLYRRPPNFETWRKPHPSRAELEGEDGLQGSQGPLRGLELVWLRDRLEAFLVQVQGSARLQLTDGTEMSLGYAGATDYPYTSIGRELAKDGKLPLDGLTIPVLLNYFRQNPLELNNYLPRNRRFIFFEETNGKPAIGSLQLPVTAERSIATDKSLMPPGALALIHTNVPFPNGQGEMEPRLVSRYVLDQDTGSAIKGPGRVDYYMGTGREAGDRAGVMGWNGQLYYLLLRR